MKELLKEYINRREEIKERLEFFKETYKKSDKDIFRELCFCILTPQAKAVVCDGAIRRLEKDGVLFVGDGEEIRSYLSGVRFPNNKARYLVTARDFFKNGKGINIKSKIDSRDLYKTRDWLVKNVQGLGYKEASHFLRNIGLGRGLAILDRHILRNLKRYGVINKVPVSLSRKNYVAIEDRIKEFSKKIDIPMEEIDLLFWAKETGMVFK